MKELIVKNNGVTVLEATLPDSAEVTDNYHSFSELYKHRIELWIALCRALNKNRYVWRSELHSDGSAYDGWFILGVNSKPGSQITYHLPMSKWEDTEFAITLERAPEFDGHTSADVLDRIKTL